MATAVKAEAVNIAAMKIVNADRRRIPSQSPPRNRRPDP